MNEYTLKTCIMEGVGAGGGGVEKLPPLSPFGNCVKVYKGEDYIAETVHFCVSSALGGFR